APIVVGRTLESMTSDMRGFWRAVTGEQQLRWIGPEKGAIHLAAAALINAVWDLYAKVEGKPLWKLLADMTPEQLVSCIDFRYISDALTPEDALSILERQAPTRAKREAEMLRAGFPAYTTSAGWLGYSDEKLRELCREAIAAGWSHVKMKVGQKIEDDVRRARIVREEIGPDRRLPSRWAQRGPGGPPAGGEVRRAGVPARRRRGALRVRPAHRALRLHRGERDARESRGRVRRAPARAFPRPGDNSRRMLRRTARPGLQHHNAAGVAA